MLEKEIETITRALQASLLPTGRTGITVKDILASDAPHPIKAFFRADVEALLHNEQQSWQRTTHFKIDHPEVRSLQSQINSILILEYEYSAGAFSERLTGAVRMIVNYLLRPQWTMVSVIFEKEETTSTNSLTTAFHYFGAYDYLKDIIIRYLREKNPPSVSKKDLASLLWKADSEYIQRKTGDELARIMSPLFEFFDYPAKSGSITLPAKAFLRYLEDKGLTAVSSHLEGEIAQGKTTLTQHELAEILESVRRTSGPFRSERTEHAPAPPPGIIHPLPEEPKAIPPSATESVPESAGGIELLLSEHDKRRIVKKLFNQDETVFHSVLHELGMAPTWKQASRLLDETFIHHEIDPYTSEAERFVDYVFEYFHPKQ